MTHHHNQFIQLQTGELCGHERAHVKECNSDDTTKSPPQYYMFVFVFELSSDTEQRAMPTTSR